MDRIVEEIKKQFDNHENRDKIVARFQVFYTLAGILSGYIPQKVLLLSILHASKKMGKTITFMEAKEHEISEEELEESLLKAWLEDETEAIEIEKH